MLEKCIDENFMHKKHLDMWTFVDKPEEVIPAVKNAVSWGKEAINFALNR